MIELKDTVTGNFEDRRMEFTRESVQSVNLSYQRVRPPAAFSSRLRAKTRSSGRIDTRLSVDREQDGPEKKERERTIAGSLIPGNGRNGGIKRNPCSYRGPWTPDSSDRSTDRPTDRPAGRPT